MRNIMRELRASLTRNASMTISLVVTMTVSLMLASLGLLIQAQIDRTTKYFGDRLQIQVTLCKDKQESLPNCETGAATDEQKQVIVSELEADPNVKSVTLRTSQDNYDRAVAFYGQSESGRQQLQYVTAEDFPESYMVTLKDPDQYQNVSSKVMGMQGVGSVLSLREVLAPLFAAMNKLQWAALGTSLLLVVAAILQVSNTIRMTAFARRREIGIMRLVGASSWHIQMPFLLESLVAAVISAALSAVVLSGFMYRVVYVYLREQHANITTWVGWHDAAIVMGWTTLLALALALIPTLVMTRKYLNV